MNAVKHDWTWSDRFIPEIRKIVGPYLLEPASLEVDRNQATDLVTLRARDLQIACRIRRPAFSSAYLNQFTIRSHRSRGTKTELGKIIDGFGDWMFYGFANGDPGGGLAHWSIIDLHAFRSHLIRHAKAIRSGEQSNPDGTSFRWFDLESFPDDPPLIVAQLHNPEKLVPLKK